LDYPGTRRRPVEDRRPTVRDTEDGVVDDAGITRPWVTRSSSWVLEARVASRSAGSQAPRGGYAVLGCLATVVISLVAVVLAPGLAPQSRTDLRAVLLVSPTSVDSLTAEGQAQTLDAIGLRLSRSFGLRRTFGCYASMNEI
jgi:hypothetical protein